MQFVVKKSKIRGAGKGLFALKYFPEGVVVGEYTGDRSTTLPRDGRYTWEVKTNDSTIYIDAKYSDCPLRYANGAKTKRQHQRVNLATYCSHGVLLYVTSRSVRAGEEFILDYGNNYWQS
jgi:hypothetical protein